MPTRALLTLALCGLLSPARAADTVEVAGLSATVPAAWKKEKPSNAMRVAQYSLPKVAGDADDAELSVFAFPGGSGSLKANLARQTAAFVDAGRTASDKEVKIAGHDATLQDVTGTFKKKPFPMAEDFQPVENYRQLYVVFEANKQQVYIKLLGPKETVAKHQKEFEAFLASFK